MRRLKRQQANGSNGDGSLLSPNQTGATTRMAEFVSKARKSQQRTNTSIAYDPKQKEFELFCEAEYAEDQHKYSVDADKVYRFMFYQAFREQKKRGGRQNGIQGSHFAKLPLHLPARIPFKRRDCSETSQLSPICWYFRSLTQFDSRKGRLASVFIAL